MLEHSDEDGSDYEDSAEDFGEDFDGFGYLFQGDYNDDVILDVLLTRLEDSNRRVRYYAYALEALYDWENTQMATLARGTMFAQRADAVVAMLEDSEVYMRILALAMLGRLEPAALTQHADIVVARLEDADETMRTTA